MRPSQVVSLIVGEPVAEPEARLRYQFYSVFASLALPVMLTLGPAAIMRRDDLLGGLILASAVGLTTGWLRLRFGRDDRRVYRVNALLFAVLALTMMTIGGEAGSMSLWLYWSPLIVAFLFGEREGALWGMGLLVGVSVILWVPLPFPVFSYAVGFKARFTAMYLVILVVSLGFESSRRRYHDAMRIEHRLLRQEIAEREKAEREKAVLIERLQDSLAQVKTLSGLVPICAHCHRIRDDQGFWNQLEVYLKEHSDASFSHGICPGCLTAHYPEFNESPGTVIPQTIPETPGSV